MPIHFKLNSRIRLSTYNNHSLTFTIDQLKNSTFYTLNQEVHEDLLAFIKDGIALNDLKKLFTQTNENQFRTLQFIQNLEKNNFIDFYFDFGESGVAIISPTTNRYKNSLFLEENAENIFSKKFVLSRFIYLRIKEKFIVFECPISKICLSMKLNLFVQLMQVFMEKKYSSIFNDYSKEMTMFFSFLEQNNIIHSTNYEEPDYLRFWEFHDLLFHSESSLGKSDDQVHFGGTYRFQNSISAPSIFKNFSSDSIKLFKPEMDNLFRTDPSFSTVLENRRSVRKYNDDCLLCKEILGEFLYRSLGMRKIMLDSLQDTLFRPYPAAGAIHEIEFYIIINKIRGLKKDIYYYDGSNHTLQALDIKTNYIQKIIDNARAGMGNNASSPQVLIVLVSHFAKIAWKYEKISYRCTLISAGTIFQTMGLVATSMGLGSCIVSTCDPFLFAEAISLPQLQEGAIGEFAIGSLPNF